MEEKELIRGVKKFFKEFSKDSSNNSHQVLGCITLKQLL